MTRDDFYPLMAEMLDNVKKKFNQKNKSYGQEGDLFHNFRKTAKRVMQAKFDSEYEDMYRTMLVYQDKHRGSTRRKFLRHGRGGKGSSSS